MSRVIAVANQKGGIGKTTTAVNIAFDLAEMGKKVLLIDTDGQCNSTDTCRAQVEGVATLYDLLFENERASDCIQHMEKLDVIASDKLLKNPETKFPDDATRLFTLCDACEEIREQYDFIIIDTPPTLGCMLSNALTFADVSSICLIMPRLELLQFPNLSSMSADRAPDYRKRPTYRDVRDSLASQSLTAIRWF